MESVARELIEKRKAARVTQQALAVALRIDRGTLIKRENHPQTAPEGFWLAYEVKLRALVTEKARDLQAAVS